MAAQPDFRGPTPAYEDSFGGLISRLLHDVTSLMRNEMALARMELSEAAAGTKRGVAGVAAGGAIAFAGFLALLASAILALAQVMEPWLAALIVGAVVTIVGLIMLMAARKNLSADAFRMERTQRGLRKDAHIAMTRRRL